MSRLVEIDYTNYRGERNVRVVEPRSWYYGTSQFHPGEPQWMMIAFDVEKRQERHFAMRDVHSWRPADTGSNT